MISSSADQTIRVWDPNQEEPLFSFFPAGDDWVAWTPAGYYAASPTGERLMGWHLNNGPDRMATFHPASRFHKSLYRPDVLKLILAEGSVEGARKAADRASGKANPPPRVEVEDVLPPQVSLTFPGRSGLRVSERPLVVRATARSVGKHPITTLRLLLDGRSYQGKRAVQVIDPPRMGAIDASWDVDLEPSRHRLAVQADSLVSGAVSETVEVEVIDKAGDAAPRLPVLYVLAVGISKYPGPLRLNYAEKDAKLIAATFQERSKSLFRDVQVRLLTDEEATQKNILTGLTWLQRQMTQFDVAVIFFSGHGQKDNGGALYLLPVDVSTDDLFSTAVPAVHFKKALNGIPNRLIVLLDTCHAGAIGVDRRRADDSPTDDLVRNLMNDDYGLVIMASSSSRAFSLESNAQRQGYFTLALTEGLSGKADYNHDGTVFLHELDGYVTDRVKDLTRGQQHPRTAKPTSVGPLPLARP